MEGKAKMPDGSSDWSRFGKRLYYSDEEFDQIALSGLESVGLLPSVAGPIRIERFIEKKFGLVADFQELPDGVLGYTCFGSSGATAVVISDSLSGGGSMTERRCNSTLAHEAGHMLLHREFFQVGFSGASEMLPGFGAGEGQQGICLDRNVSALTRDVPWWEYQANRMIGALLMPRPLVIAAIGSLLDFGSGVSVSALGDRDFEAVVQKLSGTFDVNPVVARIRLQSIFPNAGTGQLAF